MNHKQQKERVNLTRANMEFLKIPAPTKVPKKNGLKEIKNKKRKGRDEMKITMYVALLSDEKKSALTQLLQTELESIGYEEQAEIDEIISNGLDSRLCDLEELISLNVLKSIAS